MTSTIEQKNKTIAEFMGLEKGLEHIDAHSRNIYLRDGDWVPVRKLKYHTSWGWLMPVWFKVQFFGADIGYSFKKFHEAFHAGIDNQSIDKCHYAVYQFIVWLNNQNKNQ